MCGWHSDHPRHYPLIMLSTKNFFLSVKFNIQQGWYVGKVLKSYIIESS